MLLKEIPYIDITVTSKKIRYRKHFWEFWFPKQRKLKTKWKIEEGPMIHCYSFEAFERIILGQYSLDFDI